jgi:hypothetical protein
LENKGKYFSRQRLTLTIQQFHLKQAFPQAECSLKRNLLTWKGILQPTALSATYNVEMRCQQNDTPDVWVSGENISDVDSFDIIPHKYDIDKRRSRVRICLYLPDDYSASWFFANTIIPWTIEWLYFYEMWLATGEWLGGGLHPIIKAKHKIS